MEFIKEGETEKILPSIIKQLRENWVTGYDYDKSIPHTFQSGMIELPAMVHRRFKTAVLYTAKLMSAIQMYDFGQITDGAVTRELRQADRDGKLCLFICAVLSELLIEGGVVPRERIRLVQGYYRHATREDANPIVQMLGKYHIGLHCWLLIDDAVVDVAIMQEEEFFDFGPGPAIIIGHIPPGLELTGFIETEPTLRQTVLRLSATAGLTPDKWIQRHIAAMQDMTKGVLQ